MLENDIALKKEKKIKNKYYDKEWKIIIENSMLQKTKRSWSVPSNNKKM